MVQHEGSGKDGRRLEGVIERASSALGRLKDAIVRTSQIGKIKLDASALRRERDLLLQQLGARFLDGIERGAVPAPDDPEVARILERIREVDEGLAQQDAELAAVEAEAAMQRASTRAAALARSRRGRCSPTTNTPPPPRVRRRRPARRRRRRRRRKKTSWPAAELC